MALYQQFKKYESKKPGIIRQLLPELAAGIIIFALLYIFTCILFCLSPY
jgi:uncharacterized RDD family membrane protein YckC